MSLQVRKEVAAAAAHQAWYAYTVVGLGEPGQPWSAAPEWQKDSIRNAVDFWINMVNQPADQPITFEDLCAASHDNWMAEKEASGWVYGEAKDPAAKTHPCIVPYGDLAESQRLKDTVVVTAFLQVGSLLGLIGRPDGSPGKGAK